MPSNAALTTFQSDLLRFKRAKATDASRPKEVAEFIVRVYDCGCRISVTFSDGGRVKSYEPCSTHRNLTTEEFRRLCVAAACAEYNEWAKGASWKCRNGQHHLCRGRTRDGRCICECHGNRGSMSEKRAETERLLRSLVGGGR